MESNLNKDTYLNIITSIAIVASGKVPGVASISNESGSIKDNFTARSSSKGVEVELIENNQVIVTISINAIFGYSVPDLCCELQQCVKEEIEKTTFYKVKNINVNIVGVVFPA